MPYGLELVVDFSLLGWIGDLYVVSFRLLYLQHDANATCCNNGEFVVNISLLCRKNLRMKRGLRQ